MSIIRKGIKGHRTGILCLLVILTLILSTSYSFTAQTPTIDEIIAEMSLEQRVGQMFMVNLFGESLTYAGQEILETWQPGAVVLFGSNITTPSRIASLTNSYQQTIVDAGGIPLFIAVDQEGGIISRLQDGFTTFPVPMLLTATADGELARQVGTAMANELRAVGVNMNLAPVADLNTNINNPIIGRRSLGTNPALVSIALRGVIEGMQSIDVMTAVKHFPGHGDTSEDSHTSLPVLDLDRARLARVELPPFIASIEAQTGAIMVSHIYYTQLEPEPNTPASLSSAIVTGLLRDELSYEGIIMTDALDMDAIDTVLSPENASIRAIQAGNDLIAIGANVGEASQARAMQAVVDAIRAGDIPEAQINASVHRILSAKFRFGVMDWSPLAVDEVIPDAVDIAPLIRQLFEAGITVVDESGTMVPVPEDNDVLVIYPANVPAVREVCGDLREDVRWLAVSNTPTATEIDNARISAVQATQIIVFTRDAYYSNAQQALVNSLPQQNTVLVALQSVYDPLRFPDIGAYMLTYSPLSPSAEVACRILFGELPAIGHLAVDFDTLNFTP